MIFLHRRLFFFCPSEPGLSFIVGQILMVLKAVVPESTRFNMEIDTDRHGDQLGASPEWPEQEGN
jgi:hypothetical protein